MKIKIIFLGTSSAIPTLTRNHQSILLKYNEENILIDCGEGTQRQFRKAKINPCKLTKILITHLHGDHVFGLPGLFQTLNFNNYQKTLYIYGPEGIKKFIDKIFKTFILAKKIKIKVYEVKGKFIETPDFKISALSLKHNIPTLGYVFQEKDKLRIYKKKLDKLIQKLKIKSKDMIKLSELIKRKNIKINNKKINYKEFTYLQKGKKISIVLDTKLVSNVKKLVQNSDLAIMESTFLKNSKNLSLKKYLHLTVEESAKVAKQNNVKQLILTHLSQRYEFKSKLVLKHAEKIFKNVKIAEDFMTVEI